MLIQLPKSNDWMDPSLITAVNAYDASESGTPPRAEFRYLNKGASGQSLGIIYCETLEEARDLRDRLAAAINQGCENATSPRPSEA